MQIHLFDCKSTVPLRRGLGSNKLNLCMLVLSQLRDTYWSASVTYRLFERAQAVLDKSNSRVSIQAEQPTVGSQATRPQPNGQVVDIEHNQQYHNHQNQQQQENAENSLGIIHEPNLSMNGQTAPFWLNDSPSFSNLDQLLSPGFSIPDDVFQSFFTSYDSGIAGVYGQAIPVSNDGQIDLIYHV